MTDAEWAQAWRDRAEALEKLLVCYRLQKRPSEKLFRELERTRKTVEAADG